MRIAPTEHALQWRVTAAMRRVRRRKSLPQSAASTENPVSRIAIAMTWIPRSAVTALEDAIRRIAGSARMVRVLSINVQMLLRALSPSAAMGQWMR